MPTLDGWRSALGCAAQGCSSIWRATRCVADRNEAGDAVLNGPSAMRITCRAIEQRVDERSHGEGAGTHASGRLPGAGGRTVAEVVEGASLVQLRELLADRRQLADGAGQVSVHE